MLSDQTSIGNHCLFLTFPSRYFSKLNNVIIRLICSILRHLLVVCNQENLGPCPPLNVSVTQQKVAGFALDPRLLDLNLFLKSKNRVNSSNRFASAGCLRGFPPFDASPRELPLMHGLVPSDPLHKQDLDLLAFRAPTKNHSLRPVTVLAAELALVKADILEEFSDEFEHGIFIKQRIQVYYNFQINS